MIIYIQKMTPQQSDYFVYLSTTPERARWGVEVFGSGCTKIAPHHPYPAPGHPADHHFDFKNGRSLRALQILFIEQGSGWLQTESRRSQRIFAESVVFLLPDVWHRYRPNPKTGWKEHWVELDGWVVRSLLAEGVINNRQSVFPGVESSGIREVFGKLHALFTCRRQYTVPELANTAHELLGLCAELPNAAKNPSRIEEVVRRAERHLAEHQSENVDLEALAKILGVGYSYFRRIFREQTGLSPWQYLLRSRLARASRIMTSSEETLASIAETAGFGSAFHLSSAFKKIYGVSPDIWRKKIKSYSARR